MIRWTGDGIGGRGVAHGRRYVTEHESMSRDGSDRKAQRGDLVMAEMSSCSGLVISMRLVQG